MGPSVSGDVYVQVETYPLGMVPRKCITFEDSGNTYTAPDIIYTIDSNGVNVFTHNAAQYYTKSYPIL